MRINSRNYWTKYSFLNEFDLNKACDRLKFLNLFPESNKQRIKSIMRSNLCYQFWENNWVFRIFLVSERILFSFRCRYTTSKNLTWLQKQQLKLKERRELQLREERHPHETRLLSELKHVQSRHMKPTASHRLDGYTSDTTAFADDDDDYTIPLHINTMQKSNNTGPGSPRTLSRSFSASKTYSSRSERPFMTVKRAHERYAQVSSGDGT